MEGIRKMKMKELKETLDFWVAEKKRVYETVQDMSKSDSLKTDRAINKMAAINIDILQVEREIERRD